MLWELKSRLRRALGLPPKFLCDTCLLDYRTACTRPQRPNAVRCPDYKKKKSK